MSESNESQNALGVGVPLGMISAVLLAHEWSPDGTGEGQCECDARWFKSRDLHYRHVAGAVLAELGPDRLLMDFAVWLLRGEPGEGHEAELVEQFLKDRR